MQTHFLNFFSSDAFEWRRILNCIWNEQAGIQQLARLEADLTEESEKSFLRSKQAPCLGLF